VFPASFTSIDFETASRRPDSACQLGLVKVVDGKITDQYCWLIRPKPFIFHGSNIQIHGITPEQVRTKPEFAELWNEIRTIIGESCLVAHNASFDLRVLLSTLRTQRLAVPEMEYTCTRSIARRTWPHLRRFGLKPLSDWLGIRFQHHDALEDAIACAKLLLAAGMDQESTSLSDLEKKLRLSRGRAGSWGMKGPSVKRGRLANSISTKQSSVLPFIKPNQLAKANSNESGRSIDRTDPNHAGVRRDNKDNLQRLLIRLGFIRPLAGKNFVIARELTQEESQPIQQLIHAAGGDLQEDLDKDTHYIVQNKANRMENFSPETIQHQTATRVISADQFFHWMESSSIS